MKTFRAGLTVLVLVVGGSLACFVGITLAAATVLVVTGFVPAPG